MRLFKRLGFVASLSALLWLTGCATTGDSSEAAGGAMATGDASGSAGPPVPGVIARPITPANASSQKVAALTPPSELWARIRRGFAMPDLQGELVASREEFYASKPEYMQRMTERSSKYLFHIVEELERRGMPSELALLPFVESAFNPQAVSSARAAGMWQFMPATGSDFDLKRNVFRDDRRDVLASTRAALDYLQKLHGMFGDWHLALAAYNWGEGSVQRAIAKNEKLGLPTGYADLSMPNETRYYVPKLQAIKNIVANPAAFNTTLPLIENHPYFQSVDIAHDIDVALAAKLADVSEGDFKALNPAAHRPVIVAAGTPQILLPWDNATIFRRNLSAYTDGQFASWTAWTAPATMSVKGAASRVGMSEGDLRSINGIPPRMMIKAGSTLLVPRAASMKGDVSEQVADNGHIAFAPEPPVTRRILIKAGRRDTVASIARRYRVGTSDVASWNRVSGDTRFARGKTIVVYVPVRASSARAASGSSIRQVGYSPSKPKSRSRGRR
ncbi:MAG: transglycosylase SLT domain-containing protein [Burkholderiales bacterium]